MAAEFVGQGLGFPLRIDPTGSLGLVADHAEIRESIRLILGTAYGERPMRPEFGCGIHDLVFAPANARTAGRAAYEVQASLRRWESRIDVTDIDVTFEEGGVGIMYLSITYVISGTNDPRNLVFPFYTLPAEE
jgi:phage baseplate assembly protein W